MSKIVILLLLLHMQATSDAYSDIYLGTLDGINQKDAEKKTVIDQLMVLS